MFELLGRSPRFRSVPTALFKGISVGLGALGTLLPAAAEKAELARIAHYYATESMLVWDAEAERYDAEATPETGHVTLFDFYDGLIAGTERAELGDHAIF